MHFVLVLALLITYEFFKGFARSCYSHCHKILILGLYDSRHRGTIFPSTTTPRPHTYNTMYSAWHIIYTTAVWFVLFGYIYLSLSVYPSSPYAHYDDVIMGAIASQITSLTIVYPSVYSGADQSNIKAPRHWPLCGEFTGDRWIPRTNGQ